MSYDAQIALAERMINAKGGPVVVRATRQAAADTATDRPAVAPELLRATPNAVILPVARRWVGADVYGDGTLVTANHRMVLIAGASMPWEIMQGDTLDAEGSSYRIPGLNKLRVDPTGAVILYTLFLKN